MLDRPSDSPHTASALTRRGVLVGGVALLSGCSLRLQHGSHLPGPKESAPSDITPLRQIRNRLSELADNASNSTEHPQQGHPLAALHRKQLTHVDATLKGLGAPVPTSSSGSHTPQAAPSTSSTSTATPATSHQTTPGTTKQPSPGKSSSSGADWRTSENGWVSDAALHTFTAISSTSRPMCMCAAATGLAAAEIAGKPATWPSDATFPDVGAAQATTATAAAIDALTWSTARADPTKRGSTPDALTWLTAVQGMTQAAAPAQATSTPSPIRRYANDAAAKKVAITALQDLLTACAQAAAGASTSSQVTGVLLAWTKTLRELARLGSPDASTFPGLADT